MDTERIITELENNWRTEMDAINSVREVVRRIERAVTARDEKAEKERDEAVRVRNNAIVEAASLAVFREAAEATMIQQEKEVSAANDRATAAEAREAGMKAALNMMDECCWQAWKAFTEEGPNAAEKFLHDVCITEGIMNNDGGRIPRAALAATAPAKGDKP